MNPNSSRPSCRLTSGLDSDGDRLLGREGTALRIPPHCGVLRANAVAVPRLVGSPERVTPTTSSHGRTGSGGPAANPRRPRSVPDRLPVELLPVPHSDAARDLQPLRRLGAAADRPSSSPGPDRRAGPSLLAVVPNTVVGRRDRALLLLFVLLDVAARRSSH